MWPTGIGFAIAKKLAQNPGNTCILTSRDRARGEKAVEDLKGEGIEVEFMQLDIGDPVSVEVTVEQGHPPLSCEYLRSTIKASEMNKLPSFPTAEQWLTVRS